MMKGFKTLFYCNDRLLWVKESAEMLSKEEMDEVVIELMGCGFIIDNIDIKCGVKIG